MSNDNQIIMYQTEDGLTKIDVTLNNDTVWLSQDQMAELFQKDRSVITKHIGNIFKEGELDEKSNVHFLHIANSDNTYQISFSKIKTLIKQSGEERKQFAPRRIFCS